MYNDAYTIGVFMRRIDLTGKNFGSWSVLEYSHTNPKGNVSWTCKCSCGVVATVSGTNLRFGKTTNCGCLKSSKTAEANKTHGLSKTRVYKIWAGMIQRCTNPNRVAFKYYGERGISVCDRWKDFLCFFEDMGHPPSDKHSLERMDNDKSYEPSNCKWATAEVQSRNSRNCKLKADQVAVIRLDIEAGQTIASIAKKFKVSESLVRAIRNNEVWNEIRST
jgi:hypothetical protein